MAKRKRITFKSIARIIPVKPIFCVMRMNNIFGKTGSLLLAGALAFSFVSCDTDTRSNQSTVREAENQYETETENADLNNPSVAYEDGEYLTEDSYDYNREYAYEERDVVIDRVKNDLTRAEQSLNELGARMEKDGEQASEEMRKEWDETRQKLEQKRQELNTDLENLEKSNEENWENVRNDANESLRGFEQEWEKLKATDVDVNVNTPEEETRVNE